MLNQIIEFLNNKEIIKKYKYGKMKKLYISFFFDTLVCF